ncbi:PCDH15 isoform 34, partial [Pan troglodytes]
MKCLNMGVAVDCYHQLDRRNMVRWLVKLRKNMRRKR